MLPARESGRAMLSCDEVSKPAPPVRLVGSACEASSPWALSSGHLIASSGEGYRSAKRMKNVMLDEYETSLVQSLGYTNPTIGFADRVNLACRPTWEKRYCGHNLPPSEPRTDEKAVTSACISVHWRGPGRRAQGWGGEEESEGWEYSLSKSSSVNRLRVNFQMTKEMRPINATPPDTDSPMMVDWLIPSDFFGV